MSDTGADDDDCGTALGDGSDAKDEKLKVVVRVRPLHKGEVSWASNGSEADDSGDPLQPPQSASTLKNSLRIQSNSIEWEKHAHNKILTVDAVFDGDAGQDQVFRSVQDCVDGLLDGYDCSVFAYGQTGTGKTYTMSGLEPSDTIETSEFSIQEGYGVVPRSIKRLFELVESEATASASTSFSLYCSFLEIYNEKIYDLLAPSSSTSSTLQDRRRRENNAVVTHRAGWNSAALTSKDAPSLPIRQKLDGSVFVDGLTSRQILSRSEMLQAFREGSVNREVRDNLFNQHSSRGHSIFQITLRKAQQLSQETEPSSASRQLTTVKTRFSRLFFIDLAGSEKWRLDGCALSDKYAAELSAINKSLSALTSCVLALASRSRLQAHVPYRDSVLTRLLQSSLHGTGRTAFIVTLGPAVESLEESFSTLRFAERLRALHCRPMRRLAVSSEMNGEQRGYYEKQIQSMRIEVNRLRLLLKKAQRKAVEEEKATVATSALMEENRRLKELLAESRRPSGTERETLLSTVKGMGSAGVEDGASWQPTPRHKQSPARSTPVNPAKPGSEDSKNRIDDASPSSRDVGEGGSTDVDSLQQLDSLVTQLQSQEAQLNWMLEAEMEAQNTTSGASSSPTTDEPARSTASDTASLNPQRSWAVERMLRRPLVAVPAPLRASTIDSSVSHEQSAAVYRSPPHRSLAERSGALSSRLDYVSASSNPLLPAQSTFILPLSSRPTPKPIALPITVASPPRRPLQVSESTVPRRPPARETTTVNQKWTSSDSSSERDRSRLKQEPGKSAAILKLVGSADKTGKSRDELVDEYKRARRAELEAMMRSMSLK